MRLLGIYARRPGKRQDPDRRNKSVAIDAEVHHRAAIAAFTLGMDLKDFIAIAVDREIRRIKIQEMHAHPGLEARLAGIIKDGHDRL